MMIAIIIANIYYTRHFASALTYIDSFTSHDHLRHYYKTIFWVRKLNSDSNPRKDLNPQSYP